MSDFTFLSVFLKYFLSEISIEFYFLKYFFEGLQFFENFFEKIYFFEYFLPTWPLWAELVLELPCPSVCLSAPSCAVFFKASHWPSDHMTRFFFA